ncbi:YdeI/OmpD-associated family protein [Rhodoferax mekongensis]|uniref:YdeI/OmpD-associated family protein n=1 Tax=Rhodoferax mekongensis TaxID=3068341 RepID=UPI0028BE2901|nr:YdeI/OmpD-associated family protein [Rhodoferax sp. TBRC 17199]MDT7513625.1 YdeI/OmpD-associated family protein [Rhodoferax sp. TBRC 17199]
MSKPTHHSFETPEQLHAWLRAHHASETELWVRIFKKGTGLPSVAWEDCVLAALTWGWIDGQRKSLDDTSFLQRMTPRRARSGWSQKNVQHAERLIAEGLMQAPGLAQVEAARADGRWDAAYAGSADMVIPEDFLAALQQDPAAQAFYATLKRQQLFTIYYRLNSAKRPETRQKRMAELLDKLARGERP